jgi:hypothetical protein
VNRSELVRYLQAQRYGVVSWLGPRGEPQSAVVGIATGDGGEIVFDSVASSRKIPGLRRDPRISLVVWEGERTVQLEGIADEPSGAERERIRQLYLQKFPDGVDRLSWPGITHVRITPRWARYSDFGASPEPAIVEIDFPSAPR